MLESGYASVERKEAMTSIAEPREFTPEDFLALLDERVRGTLGISLDEFVAQLKSGELDPESPGVASLAILVDARAG